MKACLGWGAALAELSWGGGLGGAVRKGTPEALGQTRRSYEPCGAGALSGRRGADTRRRLAWARGGLLASTAFLLELLAPRTQRRNFPRLLANSLHSGQPLPSPSYVLGGDLRVSR